MPRLVQFGDLTREHFAEHPVWVHCHVVDYDEPWYDETDEETFRPWGGELPVDPADGIFLVRASFLTADGTRLSGFVTPTPEDSSGDAALGTIQPQMFLPSGERVAFWLGMFGKPTKAAEALYAALRKTAADVFPVQFVADALLARRTVSGAVEGFYIVPDGSTVKVIR